MQIENETRTNVEEESEQRKKQEAERQLHITPTE